MQKILWPLPRRLASCKPSTPLFGWHAACTFLIAVAYSIAVAVEPPTFPKPTFMRHLGCTSSIRCQRAPALPSEVPLSRTVQPSQGKERRGVLYPPPRPPARYFRRENPSVLSSLRECGLSPPHMQRGYYCRSKHPPTEVGFLLARHSQAMAFETPD